MLYDRAYDARSERISLVKYVCSSATYKNNGSRSFAGWRTRLDLGVNIIDLWTRHV